MSQTTTDTPTAAMDAFVERYIEMWHEADPARRREAIEALWRPDAANYTPSMEAVGHDELEARVARAHDAFVGTGAHRFQLRQPYVAHHGAVRVWWDMVTVDGGEVAASGQEFLVLDDEGRIVTDHQFPVEP
jgi:hypothetical protein